MATIQENITEVRENIGEVIPEGGVEGDTMFTDAQIATWINNTASNDEASLRGWKIKMANFANLVNVTDGAASREFSDLFDHAVTMVKTYTKLASGPAAGRSRVGKIVRS
jgi:hypothetical protein